MRYSSSRHSTEPSKKSMNHSFRLFYPALCLVIFISLGLPSVIAQEPDIEEIGLAFEPEEIYYDTHSPSIWLKASNQCYHYNGQSIGARPGIKSIGEYSINNKTYLIQQDQDMLITHGSSFPNNSLPFDSYIKSFKINEQIYFVCSNAIWKYDDKWVSVPLRENYENGTIIDAVTINEQLYYGIGNALISKDEVVVLPKKLKKLYAVKISKGSLNLVTVMEDNSLFVIDAGRAKKLILPDVGELKDIVDIYVDGNKSYYLSKNKIYSYDAKSYIATSISIANYIKEPRHICVDKWRNIWVANNYKLLRYNEEEYLQEPFIRLDSLRSLSNSITNGGVLSVSKGQELLHLSYENYHLTDYKHKLYYKWNNKKWQESDGKQKLYIHPIPKENSTLYVGHSLDGNEVKQIAQYTIKRYRSTKNSWIWYLLGAAGLLILLLLRSLFKLKSGIKENQLLSQQNKLKKESKELQEEVLKLQMNPHFLYNSLNSISGLIAIGDNKKARKSISSFSKMMRQILDQSRDQHISIEDEIKFLESYISLEKLNTSHVFDSSIKLDPQLDQEEFIPTMIIQPFVENAILHGLSTKEDGILEIELKEDQDYVIVTVEDNGVGRAASAKPIAEHKSAALSIVEHRLSINAFRKGRYEIIDKKREGTATGTLVTIYIPKH